MNEMKNSVVNIVDLPDEILLIILKKLHPTDALYSLVGVNEKLDKVACDIHLTRSVNLMMKSSNDENNIITNTMIDRFFLEILPRIHHNVECLAIDGCLLLRVLSVGNYPNLHRLHLVNVQMNMVDDMFTEHCSSLQTFKYQISVLIMLFSEKISDSREKDFFTNIYVKIFSLLMNLKYLQLDMDRNTSDTYPFSQSLLRDLSDTACSSSNIVHLQINMHNFDDCLCLLDGRLSQLRTLILNLECIRDGALIRYRKAKQPIKKRNLNVLVRLKSFSLRVYFATAEFDIFVVPFLCQMTSLEELTLAICVRHRASFIDGTYLHNTILNRMPHLVTLRVDLVTEFVRITPEIGPSADDIRRSFLEKGHHVDCYIDYSESCFNLGIGRCHVYSIPFTMNRILHLSHGFPGGHFIGVRNVYIRDSIHCFEQAFFARISHAFPLLDRLTINIRLKQKRIPEENSEIVEYPRLTELNIVDAHIDYVEQFLSDMNTHLPCLNKLQMKYNHLGSVTDNFTRSTTRMNCAKVKSLILHHDPVDMVHSKDFSFYFPSLCDVIIEPDY